MNNVKIKVIDSPTGKGKTTALINLINSNNFEGDKRFLVVTPYNTEVNRICESTSCISPIGKKSEDIKGLLVNGNNICCTHALYNLFDEETKEILLNNDYSYTLIIDEEPSVIREVVGARQVLNEGRGIEVYATRDYKLILDSNLISISSETGKINWNYGHWYSLDSDFRDNGLFNNFRTLTERSNLFSVNNGGTVIALTNPDIWACFETIYISSYRVKYSYFYCYCLLYSLKIDWYHIADTGEIAEGYKLEAPKGLQRIKLYEDTKYNLLDYTLSHFWYNNNCKNKKAIDKIKTACRGYLRFAIKDFKAKAFYWTVYKEYKELLTTKEISGRRWLACNTKATNKFKDCTIVAVLCDNIPNVPWMNFFKKHGIEMDKDNFRLNGLIQFLWRSNIRDMESNLDINIYIPHRPMRELFKSWLETNLSNGETKNPC